MRAQDIMTKDPTTVTADASLLEAARVMKDEDVGVVPVVEGKEKKRVVGIITDRDIAIRCVAAGRDAKQCRVSEIMSSGVKTIRESDSVDETLSVMAREQVRRIPVVDEQGNLVGIISQADVALEAGQAEDVEATVEKISRPGGKHTQ